MLLYASHHLLQRVSCCFWSSRSSPSRSCRGSADRRTSGPHASSSFRRRFSSATPIRTSSCAACRPARKSRLHRGCSPRAALAADHPRSALETARQRESVAADPRAARRDDRAALFPAFDDEPAGAGMVRAQLSRAAVPIGFSRCRTSRRCSRCVGYPFVLEP